GRRSKGTGTMPQPSPARWDSAVVAHPDGDVQRPEQAQVLYVGLGSKSSDLVDELRVLQLLLEPGPEVLRGSDRLPEDGVVHRDQSWSFARQQLARGDPADSLE